MSSLVVPAVVPGVHIAGFIGTAGRSFVHAEAGVALEGALKNVVRRRRELGVALRLLVVSLALVGCSAAAIGTSSEAGTPTRVATPSAFPSTENTPSPSGDAVVSPLDGVWATGPIPIADIKASMVAAGVDPREVDAWITEVGSPSRYSFELAFKGTSFTHSEETPHMAMQLGESGTFALSGTQLVVAAGEPGNVDTYTFEVTQSGDELSLRCVDSTEQGTTENKATHRRFTIAFYCSAPFSRQR
ncbi:MAG: hypothetical protein ACJ77D_13010 [Chloroflexota bacterium]|jgi:hypothetical protein